MAITIEGLRRWNRRLTAISDAASFVEGTSTAGEVIVGLALLPEDCRENVEAVHDIARELLLGDDEEAPADEGDDSCGSFEEGRSEEYEADDDGEGSGDYGDYEEE